MTRRILRVLPTRKFWDSDLVYLNDRVPGALEIIRPPDYSAATLVALAGDVDVLLGDVPSASVLDAAKHLQLLQIPWTGVDNVDLSVLGKYGFAVCNSHGNAWAVAELGLALVLALLKQVPSHDQAMRQGNWRRPGADDCVMPELLTGKRVGLVGYGAIGKALARMLEGFRVDLQAVAASPRREGSLEVMGPEGLDTLCEQVDILILCAPLTAETRGLLGARRLALMKSSAYLINLSRGALVDEGALYEALAVRRIAGAALDVWYQYPQRGQSGGPGSQFSFHTLDNVVMSPHRGGMVRGELPHMEDVVENLARLASGRPLISQINITRRY